VTSTLLTSLKSAAFADSLGILLPPAALRLALQRLPGVKRLEIALRRGEITEEMIRNFAGALAAEFQEGTRLPGDLALAALAVVLEQRPTAFAEEYLCDLARLRLAEMTTSSRVARECLKNRFALPKNEVRTFMYRKHRITHSRTFVAIKRKTSPFHRSGIVNFAHHAEAN
jgi:hypothetical protein